MKPEQNQFAEPPMIPRGQLATALRILPVVLASIIVTAWLHSFIPADYAFFRPIPAGSMQKIIVHMEANDGEPGDIAATRPATATRVISCEELAHVPGKSITTTTVEFPPNAYTPKHRHPGSVTVYVLNGRIRSQLGGGPVGEFGVGDSFFEPSGAIHLFAENASVTEPAEILAIFVADQNCGPLIIYDDQ